MQKQITLLFLLLVLFAPQLSAQQVSEYEAQLRASNFFKNDSRRAAQRGNNNIEFLPVLAYTSQQEGVVSYYVFNDASAAGGFVIVGGDESATEILGYCDHGTFDYEKAPENFKWWLSQYDEQIRTGIEVAKSDVAVNQCRGAQRAASATTRKTIAPLIKTMWNQDAPFNNAIPQVSGYKTFYTGCVATGMSQIMKYHQYPLHGVGEHGYQVNYQIDDTDKTHINPIYDATTTADLSQQFYADFESISFDWSNMLNSYNGSYTKTQADAVAQLMYACGVSIDMKYGTSGSGADSRYIGKSLVDYFGYDQSARLEYREHYTDDEWDQLLYDELAQARPICYSGDSNKSGHLFLCDGYSTDGQTAGMFHFNWGWGGYCDGHYAVSGTDALKPNGSGIGGAGGDAKYTNDQSIIIGLKHNDPSVQERPHLTERTGSFSGISPYYIYVRNETNSTLTFEAGTEHTMTLSFSFQNACHSMSTFQVGIKAVDRTTGIAEYWPISGTISLPFCYYSSNYSYSFNTQKIAYNGTYEIVPVCRRPDTDDDWEEVNIKTRDRGKCITITNGMTTDPKKVQFGLSDSQVGVDRFVSVTYDSHYEGEVTYTSSNPSVATVDAEGRIRGIAPGSATITVQGKADKFFLATKQTLTVQVVKKDILASEFTIDQTSLYVDNTAQISSPADLAIPVSYSSSDPSVATVSDKGLVTAESPGSVVITASLAGTAYYPAVTQTFNITVDYMPVMFYETPYIKNGNNAYVDDYNIYLPVENKTSKYYSGYMRVWVFVSVGGYYNFPVYVSLKSGEKKVLVLDGSNNDGWPDVSYYDTPLKLYFFMDRNSTIPMNIPSITYQYRDVLTHTCTLTNSGLGTLTLPYEAEVPEGWSAYRCVDGNGYLQLLKATIIERNKPYILLGPANASAEFRGPNAIDTNQLSFADGLLVGSVASDCVSYQQGDYKMGTSKSMTQATPRQTAEAFTAFLRLGSDFHGLKQPTTLTVSDTPDLKTLVQCITEQKANEVRFFLADVNGDGVVSIADLTTLISEK